MVLRANLTLCTETTSLIIVWFDCFHLSVVNVAYNWGHAFHRQMLICVRRHWNLFYQESLTLKWETGFFSHLQGGVGVFYHSTVKVGDRKNLTNARHTWMPPPLVKNDSSLTKGLWHSVYLLIWKWHLWDPLVANQLKCHHDLDVLWPTNYLGTFTFEVDFHLVKPARTSSIVDIAGHSETMKIISRVEISPDERVDLMHIRQIRHTGLS